MRIPSIKEYTFLIFGREFTFKPETVPVFDLRRAEDGTASLVDTAKIAVVLKASIAIDNIVHHISLEEIYEYKEVEDIVERGGARFWEYGVRLKRVQHSLVLPMRAIATPEDPVQLLTVEAWYGPQYCLAVADHISNKGIYIPRE